MNMLSPHRRNPARRRTAPKKFEDEKFVSGRYDQYTRGYYGGNSKSSFMARHEDAENHFTKQNSRKFWGKDFAESLLEFTSIWRDLNMEIPSALVEHIGSFLHLDKSSKQRGMLAADDEFIAAEDGESKYEEKVQDSEDEAEWESEAETDDENSWDSDELDSDEDSDSDYD